MSDKGKGFFILAAIVIGLIVVCSINSESPKEKQARTVVQNQNAETALLWFNGLARQVDPDGVMFLGARVVDGRLYVTLPDNWYSLARYEKDRLAGSACRMWGQARSHGSGATTGGVSLVDRYGKSLATAYMTSSGNVSTDLEE